jgi:hypothetical protein
LTLAHDLGEAAQLLIQPGSILVVDESVYEFNGQDCPVKRYIPRKPHPNGLLVYGLAGYFLVGQHELPYTLDFEPYLLDNRVGAKEAIMVLLSRLLGRFPHLKSHLVVDSAFGSFEKLSDIVNAGGNATMSMAANVESWIWETLDFNCGIDEGRLAFYPKKNIVISSYKVLTETGNEHQIKTISSGCGLLPTEEEEEDVVVKISDRRSVKNKLEYNTHFADGREAWLPAYDFIDDDGTTNFAWLQFADESDLKAVFSSFTHKKLQVGTP